jgi:flagellar motor switch protein FliN
MTNDDSSAVSLNDLGNDIAGNSSFAVSDNGIHGAVELEAVFDVPVRVQAVLGKSTMEVNQLLKLSPGSVIELDRRVGEAVDIFVNNRLVARGEVVIVDEHLGVTMTEIVKQDKNL